ncbi:hypothetical protein [Streptomyces sp. L7]|uniref:hypothetical protein n=1 Tax=Streptomyces sp. L7 TaxID=3423954 RepID=UPI003D99615D
MASTDALAPSPDTHWLPPAERSVLFTARKNALVGYAAGVVQFAVCLALVLASRSSQFGAVTGLPSVGAGIVFWIGLCGATIAVGGSILLATATRLPR